MTNQSFAGKRSFRTILTIVIALVLLVTMFAGTAFAKSSDEYTVNIVDGSRSVAVTTDGTYRDSQIRRYYGSCRR